MRIFTDKKKSGPRRKDAGQAMVELAIVLPVLLLLVFGIIEFGRVMYIKNTLTSAARAAVRVAVVSSGFTDRTYAAGSLTTRSTTDIVQQKLYDNVANLPDSNQATATLDVIERAGTAAHPNDTVAATVSIPFKTIVPGLLTMLTQGNNTLMQGKAAMRFE